MRIDKDGSKQRYKNLIKESKSLERITDFLSTKHNNEEFAELTDNFGFVNKWVFAKPYNWARSRPVKVPKKVLKTADYAFGIIAIANGPRFEQDIYAKLTGTNPKYLTMASATFNASVYVGGGAQIGEETEMNKWIYSGPLLIYAVICATRFTLAVKNNRGYQDVSIKRTLLNATSNYKYIRAKMNNIDLTQMSKKYTSIYNTKYSPKYNNKK